MERKIISPVNKKGIIILLLELFIICSFWSEDKMNQSLETILQEKGTSIVIYLIPFNILTRIPVSEDMIRHTYSSKIILNHDAVYSMVDIILASQKLSEVHPMNIRMLIDVLVGNETVYTIPVPDELLRKEILEAFYKLLGVSL
jgi:hypothetical protein